MLIESLKFHLKLLIQSPKDYLFSFTASNTDTVHIYPYDPKSSEIENTILEKIKHLNLETHSIGSNKFKIAGKRDLDIFLICNRNDLKIMTEKLESIFQPAEKKSEDFSEWHFKEGDFEIDINLMLKKSKRFEKLINQFNFLMSRPELIKQYEELKLSCNGFSTRQYNLRRMAFFNSFKDQY